MNDYSLPKITSSIAAAGAVGILAWSLTKKSDSRLPLPPGPKPLPLVGNLLQIPREKEWLAYHKLAQGYGDIIHLEALGQHLIILDSLKATNDLFERRSTIYSSRASPVMLNKLMDYEDWNFAFQPYGETWRKSRRIFHSKMHAGAVPKYQGVHIRQARQFLKQLMADPEDLPASVRGTVGATIMDVVYGIQVTDKHDHYISIAEKALQIFALAASPGAFLVDLLPALKYIPQWFPGADFQRLAALARKLTDQMVYGPIQEVERTIAAGTTRTSMASELLQGIEDDATGDEKKLIEKVVAVAYGAGSDTTVSTLLSFFLAMANYPEVQAKAQAEVDAVVGSDRLPDFTHSNDLPYINAILSELLRWQPVIPLGVPHTTTADDEYNGYFIPKGSLVLGNVWAILHDPKEYPQPEEFRPERFLDVAADGRYTPNKEVRDPRVAFFGFGRRVCAGRHLAEQSLFAIIASVLCAFSIAAPLDEQGRPEKLKVEMSSGTISHPAPFKCTITPRSQRAEELIGQSLPERGL